jgi:KDO2-lipid IV(A) lauroyltransferase
MARIAAKTGAALVPAFMVRGVDGRFEFHMERAIEVPATGNPEKDVLEMVRRYTESVESYVKAYPDQWMWMHERWKTRPPEERK